MGAMVGNEQISLIEAVREKRELYNAGEKSKEGLSK